jgi:RNA polymerase sigma-70 factor (ECF subfamily)
MKKEKSADNSNLFDQIKKGHATAFDQLFREQHAFLCKTAYRLLGDTYAAEEVVQELFLEIWNKKEQLNIPKSISAYLRQATINKSYDFLRKKIKEQENITYPAEAPIVPIDTEKESEAALETTALKRKIQQAIEQLPPRCKIIFKLNRFENLSYREIAEHLEISQNSVEKQISKALQILRKQVYLLFLLLFNQPPNH